MTDITTSEFISKTRSGESFEFEAEDGFHKIERIDAGYYSVDGHGRYTLTGLQTWFGYYDISRDQVMFSPR